MEFLKNKLFLAFIVATLLVAVILWLSYPKSYVVAEKLKSWVSEGYTQQFCKVVYPRVAKCVKFSARECNKIVKAHIEGCIDKAPGGLPAKANQAEVKEIYQSFAQCFQEDVRASILKDYLVDSKECRELFS